MELKGYCIVYCVYDSKEEGNSRQIKHISLVVNWLQRKNQWKHCKDPVGQVLSFIYATVQLFLHVDSRIWTETFSLVTRILISVVRIQVYDSLSVKKIDTFVKISNVLCTIPHAAFGFEYKDELLVSITTLLNKIGIYPTVNLIWAVIKMIQCPHHNSDNLANT